MTSEQVQWTEAPIPTVAPREGEARYRGLRLHVQTNDHGYASWSVSFRLAGIDVLAHEYDRLTFDEARTAAIVAADRLIAAGAEPRDRLAVAS
jgi:hypothetical protein